MIVHSMGLHLQEQLFNSTQSVKVTQRINLHTIHRDFYQAYPDLLRVDYSLLFLTYFYIKKFRSVCEKFRFSLPFFLKN